MIAKLAVVLGSAASAIDDITAAGAFLETNGLSLHVVCLNDSIRACPTKPVAFCTIHSANVPDRYFGPETDVEGVQMFTRKPVHGFRSKVVRAKWLGTTGLYAVQIALDELGFDGVILAGVPMDADAGTNYGRETWASDGFVSQMRPAWLAALPVIGPRVRSMSGWTRELFGEPSEAWLETLSSPLRADNHAHVFD